jgi:RNA polymerase sigma factor (sigma-70 family)
MTRRQVATPFYPYYRSSLMIFDIGCRISCPSSDSRCERMSIFRRPPANIRHTGEAEAALRADYEQFQGEARAFAARYVGKVWADDVVQDAFVDLWIMWYKEGHERPLESSHRMFYRILRRRILDRVRELRRESDRNENPAFLSSPHLRLERGHAPAQVADASILADRIEYHVDRMPEAMRRVHRTWQDLDGDVPTTARMLGMKEKAVYKQLDRSRALLREQLRKDGYDIPGASDVHQAREGTES